jgi:hypothetical protein
VFTSTEELLVKVDIFFAAIVDDQELQELTKLVQTLSLGYDQHGH